MGLPLSLAELSGERSRTWTKRKTAENLSVYDRKLKWKKYDSELTEAPSSWGENYVSAAENVEAVEKQFQEESDLGMMVKFETSEAIG